MKVFVSLFFSCLILTCLCEVEPEQSCSKDGGDCSKEKSESELLEESRYNEYQHKNYTNRADFKIHEVLDKIDGTKKKHPEDALKMCEEVLSEHPFSPRALHTKLVIIIKQWKHLDSKLKVGKNGEDLVNQIFDTAIKISKLDSEDLSSELWLYDVDEITDLLELETINNMNDKALEFYENVMETMVYTEADTEDMLGYFKGYLTQLLISGQYRKVQELLAAHTPDDPNIEVRYDFKAMGALAHRMEKFVENNFEPYEMDDKERKLIEELIPTNLETQIIPNSMVGHLDKPMRHLGKTRELYAAYDFLVDVKIYKDRYQRCNHYVPNLRAKPVWTVEETGYQDFLGELEANWEAIRDEGLELIKEATEANITYGEASINPVKEQWKQYLFHGFNYPSFPDYMCKIAKTACRLIKDYKRAINTPMGTIKYSYIAAGAYIHPHTGGNNYRVRAHLPLVVPKRKEGDLSEEPRMSISGGDHIVTWQEGKILVFDDSFEHEVFNPSSEDRLILIVDLVHPDMTDEQEETLNNSLEWVLAPNDDPIVWRRREHYTANLQISESTKGLLYDDSLPYFNLKKVE